MVYTKEYLSPVGQLLLAADERGLLGLWMEGQKYYGDTLPPETQSGDTPLLRDGARWLDAYFAGNRPPIGELALAPRGGEFRQAVWRLLCAIPYGEICTYGELGRALAAEVGRESMSAQAVGGAVGHNHLSIIIPCHRVVGANGSLTGYAGGVGKKLWLLRHEGVDISRLTVPVRGTAL